MQVTKIHEFTGHVDCLYTCALSTDGKILYTAGGDGLIVAWDLLQGGDGVMQVKVGTAIYSMCLWDDSKLLLGSTNGNLFLINLTDKKEERNIEAHQGGIFDIVYDADNKRIITVGFDGVMNIWNEELELIKKIKLSGKSLRAVLLLPNTIAVASSDFVIYILDHTTFEIKNRLQQHTNSVFALAYNPIRKELLSGGRDCFLKIWDTDTFTFKQDFIGATLHINGIVFDPGYRYYCVSSMDKTLKIFDAETHLPIKFIDKQKNNGHLSSVNKALWVNPQTLVSVSDDKKAMVWEFDHFL